MKNQMQEKGSPLTQLDRAAIATMLVLGAVAGMLVWSGNACGQTCFVGKGARVREFSWQERRVGASDRAFILSFNRPVDRKSVEENLRIDPPLPGKFSWAGQRLAYTLTEPAPYGTTYNLHLDGVRERYGSDLGNAVRPFSAQFQTRDRIFAYIGVTGEEQGRLVLFNLTQQKKTILTPPELVVIDFKPAPSSSRLLFLATDRQSWQQGLLNSKLYETTTDSTTAEIQLILDSQDYQILQFDIAQDNETLVVRRLNRSDPADFGLWALPGDLPPRRLDAPQGGEFAIAPDSETLALAQGEGIALIPIESETEAESEAINFLPKYGQVLDFSRDGTKAAMVNFNTDNPELRFLRSLFVVGNNGVEQKLLDTDGSILSCEFTPQADRLYCLLTRLVEEPEYIEQPYLVAIDLASNTIVPLLSLPAFADIHMSLAPDGLAIVFDQVATDPEAATNSDAIRTDSGEAIVGSRLWLVVPEVNPGDGETPPAQLEELPIAGSRPRWLP